MEALAERVFAVAEQQATLLASQLDSNSVPRTLNPDGTLVTTNPYWWCSGFFPGTLWYIYKYSGSQEIYDLARQQTLKCEPIQYVTDNHDLGFMINCSYGNAIRIGGLSEYEHVMQTAAHSLATRYNPIVGCTKSWDWFPNAQFTVIIDNMMNLELLVRSGDPELIDMARNHAATTAKHHFRDDYTTYHVVDYNTTTGDHNFRVTHQGYSDESTWARGEAWALYGYTMMAELTGDAADLDMAEHIARWTIDNLPEDGVQYWDYLAAAKLLSNEEGLDRKWAGELEDGSILRDASAAAITASAFVKLSELTADKAFSKECLAIAEKQVRALASPEYLAAPGELHGFLLKHGTGHYHGNSEIDVPLTYADYYFLEAILRLNGIL